jgi:hypothetical protein
MRKAFLLFMACMTVAGCSSETDAADVQGDEADVTGDATIKLTADFRSEVVGRAKAGKGLRVEYALERLPQCRGNVGGGGPGWNITGFYSENGGTPKTFEVSEVRGNERVAKPARIALSQGGDLALWFQVSSRFGCSEFDSQFGQNFHLDVEGAPPEAQGSIVFEKDGAVKQTGALVAGGKVKIRYAQERLPQCRRSQGGNPQWTITGFASLGGGEKQTFQTGRPEGSDRESIDAILDLPRAGELALWFQVTSLGGCTEFDSKNGANYRFRVE